MSRKFHLAFFFLFVSLICILWIAGCSSDDDDTGDDDTADDDDDAAGDDDTTGDDDTGDNDADPDWRYIFDDQGRALVLHGVGISNEAKLTGHPWISREEVLDMSKDWGFNFVRYLIFWILIEPEPGVYNEVYLDELEERLDWYAEAGIHVVLDMHQDLWGPSLNCLEHEIYNGAPDWATITDDEPYIPFCEQYGWGLGYMSPDMIRAFDNFFDYEGAYPELQDHYRDMFVHVVERFKDHPAILGYELMNEPWHGADILNAKNFDETKMHSFIQRMVNGIRVVDEDGWIFYEPRALGPNQGAASYIPRVMDPRSGPARLVYFPHIYPVAFDMGRFNPQTDKTLAHWSENRTREMETMRTPLAVGEWNWSGNSEYLKDALAAFDTLKGSWAYYAYDQYGFDPELLHELTRPYVRRIAGRPVSWEFHPETRTLQISFEQQKDVTGPTEIYLSASRYYPDGWTLEVSDSEGTWSSEWDQELEVLRVTTNPDIALHTIKILPAQ